MLLAKPLCLVLLLACASCYEAHYEAPQAAVPPTPAAPSTPTAMPAAPRPSNVDAGRHAPPPPIVTTSPLVAPEPNLRVAFLGDQGLGEPALAVLRLIAAEDADLVVHAGDLAYVSDVEGWTAQVDAVLGPAFPYFVAIGNHDVADWSKKGGYREVLLARLARTAGATCEGDYGVNTLCRYRGLAFVLSGIGTHGSDHEAFLDEALSDRSEVWRLCVWHKNQHDMQVGTKTDEVGWDAYQTCAAHGAPIITAHEHSYSRTFALLRVGRRDTGHGAAFDPFDISLEPGRTMVVVTGLGGHSNRAFTEDHAEDTWWASIYAGDLQVHNGVVAGRRSEIEPGALFIDFHVDGDPHRARGYFKTTSGAVVDDFELTTL